MIVAAHGQAVRLIDDVNDIAQTHTHMREHVTRQDDTDGITHRDGLIDAGLFIQAYNIMADVLPVLDR